MAGIKDIANIWKNVREIDLRPIRQEAETPVKIAVAGRAGAGRHTLAEQMRSDPSRPQAHTQTPLMITELDAPPGIMDADLIILMMDATVKDFTKEQELVSHWKDAGKRLLLLVNKADLLGQNQIMENWVGWRGERMLVGSALDVAFLQRDFVPAVLALLPERFLALGRQFPLFRVQIARELINDTCISNAAYALSTGLAEIVPVLDVPLNITDMMVLTKAQAFLVYRLGLTLGFSTRWQDYIAEFGSVLGTGFVWRQIARELVGLIPIWGIIPKVAVSYAGTFVTGNVVLQWYLTGRHVSRQQIQGMYKQALENGRNLARNLLAKAPRPRLGRRKPKELPATTQEIIVDAAPIQAEAGSPANIDNIPLPESVEPSTSTPQVEDQPPAQEGSGSPGAGGAAVFQPAKPCPHCGKLNAADAHYCQYCGKTIE